MRIINYSAKIGPWYAVFLPTLTYFSFSGHNLRDEGLFILLQEVDLVVSLHDSIIVLVTLFIKEGNYVSLFIKRRKNYG